MSIGENLNNILSSLPQNVRLVIVSKTRTNEEIMEVYNAGHRILGENKVQELIRKQKELPEDIEWHLIGHLQTNKVKQVIPYVSLIHSVDSFKLLKVIDREAGLTGKTINCLLQFHIAQEETKFGFSYEEAVQVLRSPEYAQLKNIRIIGVMGMATFTGDTNHIREEFRTLAGIYHQLKDNFFISNAGFKEISMGMSDDYHIAVEEGSTIVRIGSKIFGPREYSVK